MSQRRKGIPIFAAMLAAWASLGAPAAAQPALTEEDQTWRPVAELCRTGRIMPGDTDDPAVRVGRWLVLRCETDLSYAAGRMQGFCYVQNATTPFCPDVNPDGGRQEVIDPCPSASLDYDESRFMWRCLPDDLAPSYDIRTSSLYDVMNAAPPESPVCGHSPRYALRLLTLPYSLFDRMTGQGTDLDIPARIRAIDMIMRGWPEGGFDPLTFTPGPSPQDPYALRFCLMDGHDTDRAGDTAEADRYVYLELFRPEARGTPTLPARLRTDTGERVDLTLHAIELFTHVFRSEPIALSDFASASGDVELFGAAVGLLDRLTIVSAAPSAELRPAEPPLRPERFAQLTLEAAPELSGTPLRIVLEGRHRAFPEGEELVAEVPALFPIDGAGCRLPGDEAAATLICEPDADRLAGLAIETPVAGFLHWEITDAETGDPLGDGLLEIQFDADGTGTGAGDGSDETPTPAILQVLTVYPQLGLSDLDDFATRYPDPSDPFSGGTGGTRHLLVIGRDLPQSAAETDLADTPGILYSFAESPDSVGAHFEHSMLREGLSRLAGDAVEPQDMATALRDAGLDVIVLRADLRPGVLPGEQIVALNGAQAAWQLRFGNLGTTLDFVRASGDPDRPWEPVGETPGQEVLSLRLRVTPGIVPYGDVPARVAFQDPESGTEQALDLVLSPQSGGVWLSPPFGIGVPAKDADGRPLILDPGAAEELIVTGTVAENFALQRMPAALGQRGALLYFPTEVDRPFAEDLETAAQCSGLRPEEWTPDQLANSLTAFDDGDPFANFIITMGVDFDDLIAGGNVTQDVLVGHHAALLGLRRAMLVHGAERAESLRAVRDDPAELLAMTAAWHREWRQITSDDPQSPLFRISVPAEPIAETLPYGRLLRSSEFYADALREAGFGEARVFAFFEEAGRAAIDRQLEALDAARSELRALAPCDLAGMMRFARNARAYAEADVIPRLLQSDGRQFVPDPQARRWLRSAIGVADTWHAQIRASEADSDAVSLYISIVTLPLAPLELGVISSVLMVQNLADMALSTASLGMRYAAAQDELRLALGLTPLLGEARLDTAEAELPSFAGFVAQTGLNLVSLGFDVAAIRRAHALGALAEAGEAAGDATRTVTRISPEGLGALAELRDALLRARRARLAPDRPERIALSAAQSARLAALGSDAGGLPRLFPFVSDAPTFSLADRLDGTGLDALEAIDSRLEDLVIDLAEDDLAALFSLQTRQILRDPGVVVGTRANLTDVIAQAAYRPDLDFRVHLELGPSALGNVRAFGIDWDPVAIVVHEAGHIAQLRFGEAAGLVVGRVVRELDSSLRMVVVQNALARAGTGAQAISTRDALRFAFGYALDTQAKSLRNLATGSYFQTPGRQFDGLFQVDAAEAIARARAALPDATEREILEAFIEAHSNATRTYGAELARHASWGQLGTGARWRDLVRDAQARLAALPPP